MGGTIPAQIPFFIRGVGFQASEGKVNAVVAGAVIGSSYLGVKIDIHNNSDEHVTFRPENVCELDSIAWKAYAPLSPAKVARNVEGGGLWQRFAQGASRAGALQSQESSTDSTSTINGSFNSVEDSGTFTATATTTGTVCDRACADRKASLLAKYAEADARRHESAEKLVETALVAQTIAPHTVYSGYLYFPKPKFTTERRLSPTGTKTYLISIVVPFGTERFQFVFPLR
jgi:hypothetical protein